MNIINLFSHNGTYDIQSWPEYLDIPENHAIIPDDLDVSVFYKYNGFITPATTEIDGILTLNSINPNVEAWENWKSSLPEDEPKPTPMSVRVSELEAQLAETDEVAIDLYEASLVQEAINAEQDEAIIEIYEMMEGMTNG